MASSTPAAPYVVEDCGRNLQLLSDGTVIRFEDYNTHPPPVLPPALSAVQWKDVVYDAGRGLKLRAYKPPLAGEKKLPVVVYFHGGGYVIGSYEMDNFHACCLRLAHDLPAVVLSADYRLAPEHRLPAAHDDAATVMSWVRDQAVAAAAGDEPWLAEWSADFARVFISGDSAGAGIVHHVTVRLGSGQLAVDPPVMRVAGCALLFPFFGGEERTRSEGEHPPAPHLTLPFSDQAWRLALPRGATRDHPLANPFGPESPALDAVALLVVVVTSENHAFAMHP